MIFVLLSLRKQRKIRLLSPIRVPSSNSTQISSVRSSCLMPASHLLGCKGPLSGGIGTGKNMKFEWCCTVNWKPESSLKFLGSCTRLGNPTIKGTYFNIKVVHKKACSTPSQPTHFQSPGDRSPNASQAQGS